MKNYQAAWDTVDGQTGEEEKTGYQIVLKRRRNGMKLPSSLKGQYNSQEEERDRKWRLAKIAIFRRREARQRMGELGEME